MNPLLKRLLKRVGLGARTKQQSETAFWRGFYQAASGPSAAEFLEALGLDSPNAHPGFAQLEAEWAASSRTERLLKIGQVLTFSRYRDDLQIGAQALARETVLDLGCGPLGALSWFEARVRVGVDELTHEYQEIGFPLARQPMLYVRGRAEDPPFPEGQFGAVLSVNALDHVEHFEAAIKELSRVLRPGGRVYLGLNYQDRPTECEPILLNDARVEAALAPYFSFQKKSSERTKFDYSKNCYHGTRK
jgi:SAM-dependent methyltransferase